MLRGWKFNGKLRAFAEPTMYLDGAAHLFDGMFHDGEAEAGPAHGARSCLIGAIEALEDAWKIFGGNANAGVADEDAHFAIVAAHFHLHLAVRPIKLYGIVEKVDENLLQAQLVADDLQIVQSFTQQLDTLHARG